MEPSLPNYTLSLTQVMILTKDYEVLAFFFGSSKVRQRYVRRSSEVRLRKIPERAECGRIPFNQNTLSLLKLKSCKKKDSRVMYWRSDQSDSSKLIPAVQLA
jgi:hypothetical protein